jgi:fructuronate reductase
VTVEVRGRLGRAPGDEPAPVRIVHLGLSAFSRAHQAWYTHRLNAMSAGDGEITGWGIAAFTGRRPDEAIKLQGQDGLYTLVTRSPDDDDFEVISSISAAYPADDVEAWRGLFALETIVLLTLTITEGGYCLAAGGGLDLARADVLQDIAQLRSDPRLGVRTAPAKIVQALQVRRDTVRTGLAVVSCDNVAANGERTREVVLDLAAEVDPRLRDWIEHNIEFPGTMVDRITPRTTDADRQDVLDRTGWLDQAPVITEPFSEWVIEDRFPAGRPAWNLVGAQFVADVHPHEQRKLLLLNGGHSLLAYLGLLRGHSTVAQAVADESCWASLAQWWGECAPLLPFDAREIDDYCAALLTRWGNARMQHQLGQIATDGSQKLRMRAAPVLRWHIARGETAPAAELLFAAWLANVRAAPDRIQDVDPIIVELTDPNLDVAIERLIARFVPELAGDVDIAAGIQRAYLSCTTPTSRASSRR